MRLVAEVAHGSLPKEGEELCGDKVEVLRTPQRYTVVLSDGLGSGVKANILATLTTKIAAGLLERDVPLKEVIGTIAQTLPICRERLIAYSTLAVVQLRTNGQANVVLLDSPSVFLWRRGIVTPFPTSRGVVAGRELEKGELGLMEGDFLLLVSDGVLHAGIGGLLPLGLGEEGVKGYLAELLAKGLKPAQVVEQLLGYCAAYYAMKPGDDTTVVAIEMRRPRRLIMLTGPPRKPEDDGEIVDKLLQYQGKKVVCGGTTAQIVAREMGRELEVQLEYDDPDVPPRGFIKGLDLVTEGMLTLNKAQHYLKKGTIPERPDGASQVARLLAEADEIKIVVGLCINPAHQNPQLPRGLNFRASTVEQLATLLREQGKVVELEWF